MADNLNISIPTVKQTYQTLEDQGLVEHVKNQGIFKSR
ncbi:hypothetical protein P4S63_11250 [Pseudoalteromonas sp. B193]